LLDGTTTSAVIKRMPFWGWIVIVLSVCVLVGTLVVVGYLALKIPTIEPTKQKQTNSFVIPEAFPN
jgi:hypothetical protein